jgi:hypothetical protein
MRTMGAMGAEGGGALMREEGDDPALSLLRSTPELRRTTPPTHCLRVCSSPHATMG